MSETSPAEDHTAVQPASRRPPREIKRPTPTGDPAQNGESPSAEGPGQAAVSRAGSETGLIDYAVPGGRAIRDRPLVGLDARSISAWFGDHKVLERVSLRMELGLVTALIGPSGCGKSTFLRILNRMHEMISGAALAGQVLLGDDDIYDPAQRASDVRRRIGMVFQKPNPFPAMSIYDNVASGLKLAGIRVPDKNYVVESSLRRAGLWGEVQRRLRMPGGALSGGQQQRLCIARSLAVSPDVLLMDEPCSALDPRSTAVIEQLIGDLRKDLAIVIVTHNMQQAQRVSQKCAFFLATDRTPGHIVESGSTQQIFEEPSDPRTSDYVNGRFG